MKKCILLTCAVLMMCLLVSCEPERTADFSGFTAVFMNTGKSDCIIIRIDDMTVMCDTARKADYNAIASGLDNLGITKIDCMILTHFDKDHIGSAGYIIRNYDVGTVYAPDAPADGDANNRLHDALNARSMDLTLVTDNIVLKTGNGSVSIYPPVNPDPDNDNSYSVITRVTYKNTSMLLTGDATKKRLSEFLSADDVLHYDIIKMPHHGEYTKSLASLLSQAGARYGIITCDPDKATVDAKTEKAAMQYGTELLFTYEGDITVIHDGSEFVIEK